jgi:hypothetical protein
MATIDPLGWSAETWLLRTKTEVLGDSQGFLLVRDKAVEGKSLEIVRLTLLGTDDLCQAPTRVRSTGASRIRFDQYTHIQNTAHLRQA